MDLSHVLWICGGRPGLAEEVAERLGVPVRLVADGGYRAFRDLLHSLQPLECDGIVVGGALPVPAVAAAGGRAVVLGDDRDAHILRIPCLPADASAEDVIEAAGDTSP